MKTITPRPDRSYQGYSLLYFRTLLGKRPLGKSAYSVAQAYRRDLVQEPAIGMVCFWGVREPGDMGLYLGHGRLLILDKDGLPRTARLDAFADVFIGAMYWPITAPTQGVTP